MPVRITWDEPKRRINLARHGLDFRTVSRDFLDTAVVRPAKGDRLQALGYIAGRPVSLVFRPLGTEALSLISLRPASANERDLL